MSNRTFTANEDHSIPLIEARKIIGDYRRSTDCGTVFGGVIGKDSLKRLLSQDGCAGIRYYYARGNDVSIELVVVGVDAGGKDMTGGEILERIYPCPPFCDEESSLNSGNL